MSWLLKSLSPSSAGKLITFDGNGGPEVQVVTTGLVAEGGYSFVYSAREVASSGRCFAVKKVLVQDKEMRDSAEVELSLLRAFSGTPGFVKCYGGHSGPAERGQEHWMLLEYCANGSLVDLLYQKKKGGSGEYEKRAPLDEPRVLHVFGQVVAGVAHMHAQSPPISHRDLKLENVLCTADGRYVLCDFGSAVDTVLPATRSRKQAAAEEERISKHSTLLFRAPEMCDLWRGQEVGPKADVWALGCVLYCLAFNDHPFPADSPLQILNAAWSFPPDSRRSAELHEIIRRMLTPDPADRPSAGEVVRMVETVSQGEGLPSIGGAKARWTAAFEEAAPFEANFDDPAIQTAHSSASPTAAPGAPATPPISIKLPSRSKLSPSAAASRARTLDARVLVIGQPAPAASVPVVASVSGVGSYENVGRGRAAADHPCGDGSFGAFGCEQDNTGFAAPGEPSGELARESDFGDFAGAPAMVST